MNYVDEARKRWSGLKDWTDAQIASKLNQPGEFSKVFPDIPTVKANILDRGFAQAGKLVNQATFEQAQKVQKVNEAIEFPARWTTSQIDKYVRPERMSDRVMGSQRFGPRLAKLHQKYPRMSWVNDFIENAGIGLVRDQAELVAGFILDPKNIPFMLRGAITPMLRNVSNTMFTTMQAQGALDAILNKDWDDAAINAGFTMLGMHDMAEAHKMALLRDMRNKVLTGELKPYPPSDAPRAAASSGVRGAAKATSDTVAPGQATQLPRAQTETSPDSMSMRSTTPDADREYANSTELSLPAMNDLLNSIRDSRSLDHPPLTEATIENDGVKSYPVGRLVVNTYNDARLAKQVIEREYGDLIHERDHFMDIGRTMQGGYQADSFSIALPDGSIARLEVVPDTIYQLRNTPEAAEWNKQLTKGNPDKVLAAQRKIVQASEKAWSEFKRKSGLPEHQPMAVGVTSYQTPRGAEGLAERRKAHPMTYYGPTMHYGKDTKFYYRTKQGRKFAGQLRTSVPFWDLHEPTIRHATGVWEGDMEPSYWVELKGDTTDAIPWAAAQGRLGDQNAVMLFKEDAAAPGRMYTLKGINDVTEALADMKKLGISGGSFLGNELRIVDPDGSMERDVTSLASMVGANAFYVQPGDAHFITREEYTGLEEEYVKRKEVLGVETEVGPTSPEALLHEEPEAAEPDTRDVQLALAPDEIEGLHKVSLAQLGLARTWRETRPASFGVPAGPAMSLPPDEEQQQETAAKKKPAFKRLANALEVAVERGDERAKLGIERAAEANGIPFDLLMQEVQQPAPARR